MNDRSAAPQSAEPRVAALSRAGGCTRRELLWRASVASIGAAAFVPLSAAGMRAAEAGLPGDAWHPLQLPDELAAGVPSLACAPAWVDMGDGRLRRVLAYEGRLPGPTLVARTGDRVVTRLHNGLDQPTITHWHGLVVNPANDGGPRRSVAPGGTYDYDFPVVQRAGLSFYHPHPHMLTGEQVALGLAGAFVVRDDEEDALHLPSGSYEVPLVIRDASFDNAGDMLYNPTSSGFKGKFPLVNGTLLPRLRVARGVYRFRVLNGANARVFRLALSDGAAFTIIGNDGGLLRRPVMVREVLLGMAERLDLLVDFRALGAGAIVTLRCLDARWNLLRFVGSGATGAAYTPPAVLSTIPALSGPSAPTRTFTFDGMSRINGREYDLGRIDFSVPFGVTERWRFRAGGNSPHPVHVHGAHFQVVARTGGRGRVMPWETGWKDTVLLDDQETVDVLIRFDRYRGLYVVHCHQLEHESMGMMANFKVV